MNEIRILLAACALALCAAPVTNAAPQRKTESEVLKEYQARIDAYMELHTRLEKESPPVKAADEPEKIIASQKAMAAKIRAERNPVQGAIFTPEARTIFRRRLRAQLDGPAGVELRRTMNDDRPDKIPLRIHAEYPRGWPLASVPPAILAALPPLPPDLEYRFVRNDLILRDIHANVIVDFIKDAIR